MEDTGIMEKLFKNFYKNTFILLLISIVKIKILKILFFYKNKKKDFKRCGVIRNSINIEILNDNFNYFVY